MTRGQLFVPTGWIPAICAIGLVIGIFNVYADPATPRTDSPLRVNTTPSRLQCSPVTPDTKVPWIEVSQLPDVSKDSAYFEACSDLDSAWTTQSYPNAKYVPNRTAEHEARVNLLLQGIKDYVAVESDDWVAYVNAWLGATLPPSRVKRSPFSNGDTFLTFHSETKNQTSTQFQLESKTLGVYGTQVITLLGMVTSNKRSMSYSGIDTTKLCVTSIDLQKAFENQPGYLFQPASVRTARSRPTPQELTKLGGQWFGYQVHVFSGSSTGKYAGLMRMDFGFKPCASSIQIELSEGRP